jgi:2-polyprenyl-6-methoxyphenol hydroxylase-like FAD-dependent oxidoreductase
MRETEVLIAGGGPIGLTLGHELAMRVPPDVDPDAVDPRDLPRRFIGTDIDAEILVANLWAVHLVLARVSGH